MPASPPPLACLITFGCQMNEYDSGRLGALLRADGWELTKERQGADFIFFNTCAIREKAAQKVLQHLRQLSSLKKAKPELIVGVGGCVAEQMAGELHKEIPWLDIVIGPQRLPELPGLLRAFKSRRDPVVWVGPKPQPAWGRENLEALNLALAGEIQPPEPKIPYNGSITIMQGCDNYCAYCVVPYVRGPERSRPLEEIVQETRELLAAGVLDITLLGQNVNSYGRGLSPEPSFPELLKLVAAEGPQRLRFTTSHPKDFSPELVELFGTLPCLCESLHLPLQSGSDRVLSSMGRVYNRAGYLKLVEALRRACPDLALSTDIIVGFPGETEEDFAETLALVEAVGYDSIFSFRYSDRPKTRALHLPGRVPEEEKARRLTILQARQKSISAAKNQALVGRSLEVLVERPSGRYPGQLTGRTRHNKLLNFDGPEALIGCLVQVRVTEAWAASLRGVLV